MIHSRKIDLIMYLSSATRLPVIANRLSLTALNASGALSLRQGQPQAPAQPKPGRDYSSLARSQSTFPRLAENLSPAARACRFYGTVCAQTGTTGTAQPAPRDWVEREIDEIAAKVSRHPVLSNRLLRLLEMTSLPGRGYTARQIDLITLNYFRACLEVIPGLKKAMEMARTRGDDAAVDKLKRNLDEEEGEGDPSLGHRQLALNSLNPIRKLHGCAPLTIEGTLQSPDVLLEVKVFLAAIERLHQDPSAQRVLAATFADERVSLPMMTLYFNTLVKPFESCFTKEEWAKVREYWDLHTSGMEARHAEDLLVCLKNACVTKEDVQAADQGAMLILTLLNKMMSGLYIEVRDAASVGPVVAVPWEAPRPRREGSTGFRVRTE